ncbi:MAG: 1-acyl-sn-glycerol-3-phosphate acyltransferase [Oscillospiraceae bacterium]|nr:1-acyl-sn-glycerol-3-phosphate acyltransferase [Oscillospiraceae bacterium]
MRRETRTSKETIKIPNGLIYFIAFLLLYPFLKLFFRLKVDRRNYRPPKGPFIVLSNHISFMDFALVMMALYPRRLNAVTAQKFFYFRPLSWLLPVMGCIPKNLFDSDVRSVKHILNVYRRGGRILIFPEGRCATDGVYAGMSISTGKLIKKLEAPVVSCRLEGSYTCMPGWRNGLRFGRVRVTLANLFDSADAQRLTLEEINDQIDARLSGADAEPLEKPLALFRTRRLAEGLEHFLYYCPKCQREFTMETSGNVIRCTACDNAAALDRYGNPHPLHADSVVPETIHQWNREQTIHEMRSIHAHMPPVQVSVLVRMPAPKPGDGLAHVGRGILSLDPTGWRYAGELKGRAVELFFPLQFVPAIPYDPNNNFQIYANGNFYSFTPTDNPSACSKYAIIGEGVYRRFAPHMQMTAGYNSGFEIEPRDIGSFEKGAVTR